MAWVFGAPEEQDFTRVVSVQTYVHAPQQGEHWTVIDKQGLLADVEITDPEAPLPERRWAWREVGERPATQDERRAVPSERPLERPLAPTGRTP